MSMRVKWDAKYVKPSIFTVPKLALKKDERARICVLDSEDMLMGLSHNLQFGDPDSKDRDRRNGAYKCLGDATKILGLNGQQAEGNDPVNCPFCNSGFPVAEVKRHFIVHILRYITDQQGKVRSPVQFDIMLWKFNQQKFDRLMYLRESHPDLSDIDLNCICTESQFQKWDIDAATDIPNGFAKCIWNSGNEEFAKSVVKLFDEFRKQDSELEPLLSTAVSKEKAQQLLDELLNRGNSAPIPKEDLKNPVAVQAMINGDKAVSTQVALKPNKNVSLMDMLQQRKQAGTSSAN